MLVHGYDPNSELPRKTTRPRGDRISASALEHRIHIVMQLVEEGCARNEIIAHYHKEYGVSRSTTDRYIESAYDYFKDAYRPQLKRSAEIAKRRFETIFCRAMKKEYYRVALSAQSQLSRIQGLFDNSLIARIRVESTSPRGSF